MAHVPSARDDPSTVIGALDAILRRDECDAWRDYFHKRFFSYEIHVGISEKMCSPLYEKIIPSECNFCGAILRSLVVCNHTVISCHQCGMLGAWTGNVLGDAHGTCHECHKQKRTLSIKLANFWQPVDRRQQVCQCFCIFSRITFNILTWVISVCGFLSVYHALLFIENDVCRQKFQADYIWGSSRDTVQIYWVKVWK